MTVRALETLDDYERCQRLQHSMWGERDVVRLSTLELVTAQRNGGLVLGAFTDHGDLVGFVYSILGVTPWAELKHCSLLMGVDPSHQCRGVGYELKLAQRRAVAATGIRLITWTFDPLLARNAHVNFTKLGVTCETYFENAYGIGHGLSAGLESDRVQVDWRIDGALPDNTPREHSGPELAWRDDAEPVNEVGVDRRSGLPSCVGVDLDRREQHLLVQIPLDFSAIQRRDLDLARRWRLGVRESLRHYLARGYVMHEFAGRGDGQPACGSYLLSQS